MSTVRLSHTKHVNVVGVTFVDTYPHNLIALRDAEADAEARGERLTVVLVRNPANPHDVNAVEIHIPALGEMAMIGHLARDVAAKVAPRMDAGDRFACEVSWVRINPDHLDRPGIDVAIARVLPD